MNKNLLKEMTVEELKALKKEQANNEKIDNETLEKRLELIDEFIKNK